MKHLVLGIVVATLLCACGSPKRYTVAPLLHETARGSVDGQWFERRIFSSTGTLDVIELVYCPSIPTSQTVCRTMVVWKAGESAFLAMEAKSPEDPPRPPPTSTQPPDAGSKSE